MAKEKKRQPKVIVFSTRTCPHCRHAKSYLRSKGIRFTDVDVSRDAHAARDMQRMSGQQGVPVLKIPLEPGPYICPKPGSYPWPEGIL